MRKFFLIGIFLLSVFANPMAAEAKGRKPGNVYVKAHVTKRGKFVQAHMHSHPDRSKANNWSTKGNVNPNTGQPGTKDP